MSGIGNCHFLLSVSGRWMALMQCAFEQIEKLSQPSEKCKVSSGNMTMKSCFRQKPSGLCGVKVYTMQISLDQFKPLKLFQTHKIKGNKIQNS
uniref:Uncharacterized protein n=1 Tax=Neolamprologus brichardi TaxID=32507 RepID=A0A3Q4HYT4_NEOBR